MSTREDNTGRTFAGRPCPTADRRTFAILRGPTGRPRGLTPHAAAAVQLHRADGFTMTRAEAFRTLKGGES